MDIRAFVSCVRIEEVQDYKMNRGIPLWRTEIYILFVVFQSIAGWISMKRGRQMVCVEDLDMGMNANHEP